MSGLDDVVRGQFRRNYYALMTNAHRFQRLEVLQGFVLVLEELAHDGTSGGKENCEAVEARAFAEVVVETRDHLKDLAGFVVRKVVRVSVVSESFGDGASRAQELEDVLAKCCTKVGIVVALEDQRETIGDVCQLLRVASRSNDIAERSEAGTGFGEYHCFFPFELCPRIVANRCRRKRRARVQVSLSRSCRGLQLQAGDLVGLPGLRGLRLAGFRLRLAGLGHGRLLVVAA